MLCQSLRIISRVSMQCMAISGPYHAKACLYMQIPIFAGLTGQIQGKPDRDGVDRLLLALNGFKNEDLGSLETRPGS